LQANGPWVGIEAEDLDRFGIDTFPAGSRNGVHYFHLTQKDPVQTVYEAKAEAEYESRIARQRKIEVIKEGLERVREKSVSGLAPTLKKATGLELDLSRGLGGESGFPRGTSRSMSPFVGPGGTGHLQGGADWLGVAGLRALFVRPSEVVYVVGAE
jgi:hypothetical protein